jgi:hypothetical protein
MPRPTKLTAEVQRTLTFALQEGASIEHACDYAGIDEATYHRWVQRGEEAAAGDEAFSEFCEAVTRARGRGVVTDLLAISDAVRCHDWHAAAWRLQHRYPQEYGAKLKISGDPDAPLTVLQALPQDQLDARIQALLAQTGYGPAAAPDPDPEEETA